LSGEAPILEVRGLHKSFGALEVLKGIDLAVAKGELVFVIGPSGSGKSTLLRCCNRLEEPSSGSIRVEGVDVMAPGTNINAVRRRIGMVFQSFNLYPHLDALGNVTLALRKVVGQPRAEAERAGQQALARVGLAEKATSFPNELSGGQQQRVAIARALASRPAVIFADEPTGNLDSTSGTGVLEILSRSVEEFGQTVVMVTHDARVASYADRVIVLADGRVAADEPVSGEDDVIRLMREL